MRVCLASSLALWASADRDRVEYSHCTDNLWQVGKICRQGILGNLGDQQQASQNEGSLLDPIVIAECTGSRQTILGSDSAGIAQVKSSA